VLIDCETCLAPRSACRDCVVTFLLARPAEPVDLDSAEEAALEHLAGAGLVPPLRLVPVSDSSRLGRDIA
jgi:hypothetical protein